MGWVGLPRRGNGIYCYISPVALCQTSRPVGQACKEAGVTVLSRFPFRPDAQKSCSAAQPSSRRACRCSRFGPRGRCHARCYRCGCCGLLPWACNGPACTWPSARPFEAPVSAYARIVWVEGKGGHGRLEPPKPLPKTSTVLVLLNGWQTGRACKGALWSWCKCHRRLK